MRLIVFIDNCAKISLHLLCKSWSSFLDISSIWFIRNFNSFNSFLSSFSSTSVSCFLFLKQNVAAILLLLSFYQYFVVILSLFNPYFIHIYSLFFPYIILIYPYCFLILSLFYPSLFVIFFRFFGVHCVFCCFIVFSFREA